MEPKKSGWRTSEFYFTLGTQVIHLANTFGWVPQSDNAMLQSDVGKIVTGVIAAVATVAYIWGRVVVKVN